MRQHHIGHLLFVACLLTGAVRAYSEENWPQYKYDCRHSGNLLGRNVTTPLGLIGAFPLTDAIFTAPVVASGLSDSHRVDDVGCSFAMFPRSSVLPADSTH